MLGGKDRDDDGRNAREVHHGKDPEVAFTTEEPLAARARIGPALIGFTNRAIDEVEVGDPWLSASELRVLLLPGCVCAMRVLAVLFAQRDQRV